MLRKDALIFICGCFLIIASGFLFFHHTSTLDEHSHHLHAKPMFTAATGITIIPFVSNRSLAPPATDPSAPAPAPVLPQAVPAPARVAQVPQAQLPVVETQNHTASLNQPKDLSFSISTQCRSMSTSSPSMIAQWGKARAEIGLARSIPNVEQLFVKKFFSITYGVVTISREAKPISYTIIWKCANDALRKNMMAYEATRPVQNPRRASAKTLKEVESHSTSKYKAKMNQQFGLTQIPKSFTFAREPISHFISGVSEYYWRNYQTSTITTDMLKQKLDGMFSFRQLNERRDSITDKWQKYVLWHFYAMSGILRFDYNVGYLGKLETFEEDWKIINNIYGSDIKINRSLGWHESSDDPNGVKAAFKELFQRDVRYKRALCHLLYVDYVCFNYELPPECKDIAPTPPEAAAPAPVPANDTPAIVPKKNKPVPVPLRDKVAKKKIPVVRVKQAHK
jgi:hypothetical protein